MGILKGTELSISKLVGRAIMDYKMLRDRDKICVAVSGGKDSLALLQILNKRRSFVPIKYDILALHIDFGYPRSYAKKLERIFKQIGVKYRIKRAGVLKKTKPKDINCFWCSWNRRREIFQAANRYKCTKVALGHHKDDIIQTILMNLFFHGEIAAMSPKQELFGGKIKIIRPFAYVEESMIRRFAKEEGLPHVTCNCPNALTSKRRKVANIIKDLQRSCPEIRTNIFKSIKRVREDYLL
ncbi:MAG: tRNA 2-thiocytidine(32) synthetase TtcA [Candidatus Omnitrophica bacterium]|nr:tRNA 2-thiocytidine(32) synthetase TtcA [Candidatus Omnitrophota bacterium]